MPIYKHRCKDALATRQIYHLKPIPRAIYHPRLVELINQTKATYLTSDMGLIHTHIALVVLVMLYSTH